MSAKHGCLITVPFRSPPAPSSVPPSPPAVLMVNDDECPAPAAAAGTREWEVGGGGKIKFVKVRMVFQHGLLPALWHYDGICKSRFALRFYV